MDTSFLKDEGFKKIYNGEKEKLLSSPQERFDIDLIAMENAINIYENRKNVIHPIIKGGITLPFFIAVGNKLIELMQKSGYKNADLGLSAFAVFELSYYYLFNKVLSEGEICPNTILWCNEEKAFIYDGTNELKIININDSDEYMSKLNNSYIQYFEISILKYFENEHGIDLDPSLYYFIIQNSIKILLSLNEEGDETEKSEG